MRQPYFHLCFGLTFGALGLWFAPSVQPVPRIQSYESSDGAYVTLLAAGPARGVTTICLIDRTAGPEKAFATHENARQIVRLDGQGVACAMAPIDTAHLYLMQVEGGVFAPVMRLMLPNTGQGRDITVTWLRNGCDAICTN
jgi:hypothetical protein